MITQHEFKDVIEQCLGYRMDGGQFRKFKDSLTLEPDGLVDYGGFLETFNAK